MAAAAMLLLAGPLPANAAAALADSTISLTGSPYTQDFNSLSTVAGSTTNTVSILGWELSESGDGARDNEQYAVDTGGSAIADTYSYGSADSAEPGFGSLSEGTLIPTLGASFTNATGAPITSVDVAYTGEQWRLGTAGRADRLDFQLSTSATSLTTGTWTDVDALDFATPSTGAPTGERDGNDAANRTSISSSIGGLSIPDGATFWIRWASFDAAGADDGLAVDDFSLTPQGDAAPAVSASDPADGATGVAAGGSLSVTFDEPVSVAGEWFAIECATSGVHPATVSGGPSSFVLDPTADFAAGEQCTVTVVAARVTDLDTDDPPDNPTADHVFSFSTQHEAPAEPPVANDDTASTAEDSPIGIRVTANDTDVDGDLRPATVRIVVPPTAGNATSTANGTVTYTPDPNVHGRGRFTYRVCDSAGRCDQATVTVTISPVADRPVANDDTASTHEDSPTGIRVTANDTDVDGDLRPATFRIVVPPTAGNVTATANGTVTYTPDPNVHGRDRFTYRVCDAAGRCDQATVTVTISPDADRPVAGDISVTTTEDRRVVIDVTGSVVDPDGDVVGDSVVVVKTPAHGRAVVGDSITYTPDPNFHGRDRFTYRVCDALGRCDQATVTVTISPVADRPVANHDTASTAEDSPIGIRVNANDTDVDGDLRPATVQIVVPPTAGNATATANGTVTYTPDPNFHGRDRFTYRVCDALGRCDQATVTVTISPVADRPVANHDTASTAEDSPIGIRVTANDTDVDGDLRPATVQIVVPPTAGNATATANGTVTYTPDPNFHGRDRFTYRVCDALGKCDQATVTMPIGAIADPPAAVPDVVIVVRAGQVPIDVLANDTDVDGRADLDPKSVTIVAGPSLGTATVNVTTGVIEYAASSGTDGTDRLTYRVCDLGGRSATAELDIRVYVPPTTPTTTPPRPPGTLPATGSNHGSDTGAAALAAIGVGALLLVASRRTNLPRHRPSN